MQRATLVAAIAIAGWWGASGSTLAAPHAAAKVQDDKFSSAATIIGTLEAVNPLGGTSRMWRLRSWIDKQDLSVRHQLYVETSYFSHWRFWEVATDDRLPTAASPVGGGTPVLGATFTDLPPSVATLLGQPTLRCALIASVVAASVAERGA